MSKADVFRQFLLDEMKRLNIDSANRFAEYVGVTTSTITRATDERNPKKPGLEFLLKLSKATNTSLLALIEMTYPEEVGETSLSPTAQVLAQRIEKLPDHLKDAIAVIIRGSAPQV